MAVYGMAAISLFITLSYQPVGAILFVVTTVMAATRFPEMPILTVALGIVTWIVLGAPPFYWWATSQ
jgi:hypothetical protein